MARLEGRGGHPDRARAWLELGARIDLTSPFVWTNLARVARSEGRHEDEREAWRRLLGLATEHEVWLSRATEATSGSNNLVDEALAVIPEDRLCAFAARLPAARAAESDALFTVAGNKPGCQVGWAFSAFVRGEPGAALAHLGDATGCQAEQMRVMAGVAVENFAEANDIAKRSLAECGAGDRHVRAATARARLALGDDGGYAILEGILRENPADAVVRRLLAEQLLSEGRIVAAKRHFQYLVTSGAASPSDRAHLLEIE